MTVYNYLNYLKIFFIIAQLRNFITAAGVPIDGWGWDVFLQDAKVEELPLIDGSLFVEVDVNLYAPKPMPHVSTKTVGNVPAVVERYTSKFQDKQLEDLNKLLGQNSAVETKFKIISKDKIEFGVVRE